jgi:molybdate transport system substrate-binding protein
VNVLKVKHLAWAVVLASLAVAACFRCGAPLEDRKTELVVFAAASLRKPLDEMAGAFEKENAGVAVLVNCAGSGKLARQIVYGAPADVFAPASAGDMDLLLGAGLVEKGGIRVIAGNAMALVAPRGPGLGLAGVDDLAGGDVKRIAVGDPRIVPAGVYADDILSYYGIKKEVQDRLIFGENVEQLCDYIARGEVDAAIVYYSDYILRKNDMALIEKFPPGSHRRIEYPIAVVNTGRNRAVANRFVELARSARGR